MKRTVLCILLVYFFQSGLSELKLNSTYKPCDPWNPKVPDYSAPGRRLATKKCLEYIWMIKVRSDRVQRESDCFYSTCPGVCSRGGIGGRDTNDGEFPHMVALGWRARNRAKKWRFRCGGSLISDKFVLTAGHCTSLPLDEEISERIPRIVRLGNKNINEKKPHLDVGIDRIIKNPNYKPPRKYFDIALLELAGPVGFTKLIHPACLLVPKDINRLGIKATATGWGVTEIGGDTTEELQAVDIDLLESDFCDDALKSLCNRNWCGVRDHQICAANLSGGVDTCQGDSGGPLQLHISLPKPVSFSGQIHGIVGVTSFGLKCALPNTPGIYTRVSTFLTWIENNVWKS